MPICFNRIYLYSYVISFVEITNKIITSKESDYTRTPELPIYNIFSLIEPNESAVSLSLDDLASFGPPLESSGLPGGHEQSFDDGTTSFLSGTDISHDTFDLVGDSTSDGYSRRTPSIAGKLFSTIRSK